VDFKVLNGTIIVRIQRSSYAVAAYKERDVATSKPQRGRPKSNPDNLRKDIFRATMEILVQSGYQKTTTLSIAKACGISKNTLYNLFSSKESLFAALVEDRTVAMNESLSKALEGSALNLEDVLKVFGIQVLTILTSDVSIAINRSAIAAAGSNDLSLAKIYFKRAYKPVELNVRAVLKRAQARGVISFEDTDTTTQHLIGLLYGDLQLRLLLGIASAPNTKQIEANVSQSIENFMKIYGA
jgi:AcrR family transcriptional regulator